MKSIVICFVVASFAITFAVPLFGSDDDKIVGGKPTTIRKHPYQISLRSSGMHKHLCGGSIISTTRILTAAHCVTSRRPERYYSILAGTANRTNVDDAQLIQVLRLVRHPNYCSTSTFTSNDVAILELTTPLIFSSKVGAIELPPQGTPLEEGANVTVTGWGRLRASAWGPGPIILQAVSVPIVSNEECNISYNTIQPDMLCAGPREGGLGACNGDSGGPLVFEGVLHGIASWSRGCARPHYPTVYARVSFFTDWIRNFKFE